MTAESATIAPATVNQIIEVVKLHPYHRACGFELVEHKAGYAVTCFALNEFTLNTAGFLHGGVLYGLLDVSAFLAALPLLAAGQQLVTNDFHAAILSPLSREFKPTIHAQVERRGRTLVFIRCDAWAEAVNSKPKKFALATVVKSVVSGRYALDFQLKQHLGSQ